MSINKVTLECDANPMLLFIYLFKTVAEVLKRSINFGDFPLELYRVENDSCVTNAGEVRVVIYPSDAFLRFATTVFTRDFNFSTIKDTSHN